MNRNVVRTVLMIVGLMAVQAAWTTPSEAQRVTKVRRPRAGALPTSAQRPSAAAPRRGRDELGRRPVNARLRRDVERHLGTNGSLMHHVALVTGGGRGIGRGIALRMARAGARVIVLGQRAEQLEAVVAEIHAFGGQAVAVTGDVTNPESLRQAVAQAERQLGTISVLVNNAGIADGATTGSIDPSRLNRLLEVNVTGMVNAVQAVLPSLERTRGRIINIASGTSHIGSGEFPAYAISKGSVMSATRSWATEFAARGIRTNSVTPGYVEAELGGMGDWMHRNPEARASALRHIPSGEFTTPEQVGDAVVFLASRAADGINGADIPVDGGFLFGHNSL